MVDFTINKLLDLLYNLSYIFLGTSVSLATSTGSKNDEMAGRFAILGIFTWIIAFAIGALNKTINKED